MTENKNLWGGRFTGEPDETFVEFNNSFKFDRRLFFADVSASIAYSDALFHAGVLTRLESERIKNGLQTILKRADYDKNYFDELDSEDVHSFVEARLVQLIGDAGRKLHTGRSRNDQVATAFRLWLREQIEEISKIVRHLQKALIETAERQKEAVLPGYTHLQRAQPILWAHWCLAYFEMFSRDRERLDEVWRRVNVLPLGAAALAGTAYEIDREETARQLGFEGVSANSLDAVSDRDFAVEFVGGVFADNGSPVAHFGRFDFVCVVGISVYRTFRRGFDGFIFDAAKEKSRRARTDSRQSRSRFRASSRAFNDDEGFAAYL